MQLQFRKINPDAKTPTPYHFGPGHEIYPVSSVQLHPSQRCTYGTGLTVKVPDGFELQIRSHIITTGSHGLIAASNGITGSHEREICVMLYSTSTFVTVLPFNDVPIAVLALAPIQPVEFIETTPLAEVS